MTGGKTRSKTGSETDSETGRDEFMLGFRVPTTCGKKTSITTYSGEVSPPPANRTTTQCETGSETGGETGSETGGETGSETGSETSHLVKLSLPDILNNGCGLRREWVVLSHEKHTFDLLNFNIHFN